MTNYIQQITRIRIFLVVSFVIVTGIEANAQSGIFSTLLDFESNKLSYATNDESDTIKIRFNEFIASPYIIVKHNGEKIQVLKNEIYAYKNKDKIVRIWNYTPYYFLEKGPIWLYYRDVYTSQPKGMQRERKYYYSIYGIGDIQPLTIRNLKQSFPDNELFHFFLDMEFCNDAGLTSYDSYTSKYKVNDLLLKTNIKLAER